MSPFQRLVIRGLGLLIRMNLTPAKPESMPLEEFHKLVDTHWRTVTYPAIEQWERDAALALETSKRS